MRSANPASRGFDVPVFTSYFSLLTSDFLMSIVTIGLSHRTAPVELRERFAFAEMAIPDALQTLRCGGSIAEEAVILSTCNRVELYLATPLDTTEETFARGENFLAQTSHNHLPSPRAMSCICCSEPQSLEHLFRVACGLDSMVLGETEILGQLKQAYDLALQHHHTGGGSTCKAFQRAFNIAKHIRTATGIQRGSISVASR